MERDGSPEVPATLVEEGEEVPEGESRSRRFEAPFSGTRWPLWRHRRRPSPRRRSGLALTWIQPLAPRRVPAF